MLPALLLEEYPQVQQLAGLPSGKKLVITQQAPKRDVDDAFLTPVLPVPSVLLLQGGIDRHPFCVSECGG